MRADLVDTAVEAASSNRSGGAFSAALSHSRTLDRRGRVKVALVAMPFASVQYPNIQIGLLKAILVKAGFRADTFHLNLEFAARIESNLFEQLATFRGPLFGDWLFSHHAFDADPDPELCMVHDYADIARIMFEGRDDAAAVLADIRSRAVGEFLDAMMVEVPWHEYEVVGFTSTFQQTVASIALARRLKEQHPHVVTVFGGANFDGEMGEELLRTVPSIDFVVSGEADTALTGLLDALVEGHSEPAIPGVLFKRDGGVISGGRASLFEGLADNPPPDYDEYFERLEALGFLDDPARRLIDLPFESSRGCWWGQKHHCVFCGLNGQSMGYRSKPLDKVVEELTELARRYRSFRFIAVDNIIDHKYLDSIAGRLGEHLVGADLFYEIKANLSRAQIEGLGRAGITRIQPGIESLSTPVLKLMRKGITAIQNVNTLKWAHYYGIRVSWNVLWGFPGETPDEYERQARLAPNLVHIPPPSTWGRIWLERFSPIFSDEARFPRKDVVPHPSYRLVYPPEADHRKIAYFFEARLDDALPDADFAPLAKQLEAWTARWTEPAPPALRYWWTASELIIEDERAADTPGSYVFEGAIADAYHHASDKPRPLAELAAHTGAAPEDLRVALGALEEAGLMMREGEVYLALALPARPSLGQVTHK